MISLGHGRPQPEVVAANRILSPIKKEFGFIPIEKIFTTNKLHDCFEKISLKPFI